MEILRGMEVKITGVIHRLIFLKKKNNNFLGGGGGYLCKLLGGHAPPPPPIPTALQVKCTCLCFT